MTMKTPLLNPKNNRPSIESNRDGLTNSTLSNEEDPCLPSVNFRYSNFEHVEINLQKSIIVNNRENEPANTSCSTSVSKGICHYEKLISNLARITKMWAFF